MSTERERLMNEIYELAEDLPSIQELEMRLKLVEEIREIIEESNLPSLGELKQQQALLAEIREPKRRRPYAQQ